MTPPDRQPFYPPPGTDPAQVQHNGPGVSIWQPPLEDIPAEHGRDIALMMDAMGLVVNVMYDIAAQNAVVELLDAVRGGPYLKTTGPAEDTRAMLGSLVRRLGLPLAETL